MGTVSYLVLDGEIISENRNGVERDYLPDPQGNIMALLDNTQTKTDTFSYWPYGELVARTGTTPTPFQYGGSWGYYTDSSSRLYVRARCPDVVKGRWMTEDPIGFAGGLNLYGYVGQNPSTLMDPSGLQNCKEGRCDSPIKLKDCKSLPSKAECWKCAYVFYGGGAFDPYERCQLANNACKTHLNCEQIHPYPFPVTPSQPVTPPQKPMPPSNPGPPSYKPAPYPWTPPYHIPLPPKIGIIPINPPFATPDPGTGPVKGMCQSMCEALWCPGKYTWLICAAMCEKICEAQTNCHSPADFCHVFKGVDCEECCTKTLGDRAAASICAAACK